MNYAKTITLIDDDPISHLISSKIIKLFSAYAVETFTDARQALKSLQLRASDDRDQLPAYILLDIDMPGMNGWQFLEAFEEFPDDILSRMCIVMLSSSNHYADIEKSRQYRSVKHFLSKPLTEEKLDQIGQICCKAIHTDSRSIL